MLTFTHACPSEAGSGASFVFMTVKIPSKSGFSKAKVLKRQGVQSSFKILSNSKCDFHLFAQNCYFSISVTVGNFFWYQQTAVQASGMLLQEPVAPSRWVPPVTVNRMSRPCHSPTGYDNQKPVGLSDMVAHRGEHQHRKAKYQSRLGIEPPGGWSGRSLPSRNLWKRLWTPFVILVRSNTQISRQASHQFPLKKIKTQTKRGWEDQGFKMILKTSKPEVPLLPISKCQQCCGVALHDLSFQNVDGFVKTIWNRKIKKENHPKKKN